MIQKFIVGSQLYGLTNSQSDTDYLYLCKDTRLLANSELNDILLNKDIELFDYDKFKEELNKHNLKTLEVYYNYYEQIVNLVPELVKIGRAHV